MWCVPYAAILQTFLLFSMIWYVKFNHLPCLTDKIYDDEVSADRFRFQLATFEMCVFIGISRLSCSYCIWNSYCPNHRRNQPKFPLARFDAVEFNRLPYPNDKIYDDEAFADRFRYQLTMLEIGVLVRLLYSFMLILPYVIAVAKITAEICWISNSLSWFDAVEFNRLPNPNDRMCDDEVFAGPFRYQLTMFEVQILIGLSRLLHGHSAYEIVIPKITTDNLQDVRNDLRCRTVLKR